MERGQSTDQEMILWLWEIFPTMRLRCMGFGAIAPPFLTLAIDGVSGQVHAPAALFIVWEAGGPQSLSACHGGEKNVLPLL
jgi:hypothetical protein